MTIEFFFKIYMAAKFDATIAGTAKKKLFISLFFTIPSFIRYFAIVLSDILALFSEMGSMNVWKNLLKVYMQIYS